MSALIKQAAELTMQMAAVTDWRPPDPVKSIPLSWPPATRPTTSPGLTEQLACVQALGIDAALRPVPDRFAREPADQDAVDAEIAALEQATLEALNPGQPNPHLLADDAHWPGAQSWLAMRNCTIAMHPIYTAGTQATLGTGLDAAAGTVNLRKAP